MSGGWQTGNAEVNLQAVGATTATSLGTAITASGSTNTKGSYTQLIASTTSDATSMIITLYNQSVPNATMAIDIAVGGAGSEQVIAANALFYTPGGSQGVGDQSFRLPCQIPAGSRVSARCQSTVASQAVGIMIELCDTPLDQDELPQASELVGFSSSVTTGQAVDAGGTANTKGAYTQLVASTTRDYLGFWLVLDVTGFAQGAVTTKLLDVAVGGAGSEQVIVPNLVWTVNNSNSQQLWLGPFMVPIPASTRVAVRSQCSSNVSPNTKVNASIMGFY